MIQFDFSGRTALVTGGTRGIGRAVSEAFLAAGARVIATYAGNREAAERFRDDTGEAVDRLDLRCFDVADYEAVQSFFGQLDKAYEQLDVLVSNAGIRRDAVVGMMKPDDWNRVIQTNLNGTYNMCKFAVHKMMQARYGRIVIVTSPSGKFGFEGQANYAASKAGQVAFARSLCKGVARRGITVNCVSPGYVATDLIADLPEKTAKEYKRSVPVRRFGEPAEVADAILFLASQQSAYITGATLEITGGL